MNSILSITIVVAAFAGMATIIGVFNQWPAHETIGALIICVVCAGLSVSLGRKVMS